LCIKLHVCNLGDAEEHSGVAAGVLGPEARKEEIGMAKNTRQTGPKAASAAGKVLANPKSSKADKAAAASALSQTPKKGKK